MKYLLILLVLLASCGGMKEGNYLYSGNIDGDYPEAKDWTAICLDAKVCMGLKDKDYPLPRIYIYPAETEFKCGGGNHKIACYWGNGYIQAGIDNSDSTIAHECVHHWLKKDTGDLQPGHESDYFCVCGLRPAFVDCDALKKFKEDRDG